MTDNTPTPGARDDESAATAPSQPLTSQPTAQDAAQQPDAHPRAQYSYAPPQHQSPGAQQQAQSQAQQQAQPQPQQIAPYFHPQTDAFGRPVAAPTAPAHFDVNGGHGGNGATSAPAPTNQNPKRRSGLALGAALAIGALIGGASGAGITAIWAANQPAVVIGPDAAGNGTVVVNDTSSVDEITAVAAKASPSVVTISVVGDKSAGSGSGVVLSEDGYVLTNTHVVTLDGQTGHPTIQVTTADGSLYSATVVGTDPIYDLAVIKLDKASGLTPIEFADSSKLNVGDNAIAIGAPLGLAGTVTNGIVSALNRSITVASSAVPDQPADSTAPAPGDGSAPFDFWNFDNGQGSTPQEPSAQQPAGRISLAVIQTDAAINPGNSGGALVDGNGKLIGINVAIAGSQSGSGQAGNIGVGFSIPSNIAQRISSELIENGVATHGLLGATVTDASADATATTTGALIKEISSGGAAEAAGIKPGDIVTSFDGVPITGANDLTAQVRAIASGAQVDVRYVRGGEVMSSSATLGTLTM